MSLAIQEARKRLLYIYKIRAVAGAGGIKSERLLVPGEVAARAGRETARCTTYPVFLGVGLQAFTPVPQLSRVPVQLLNKPRRRALQTQPPPTRFRASLPYPRSVE